MTNEDPDYPAGMAMVELVGGAWARPAPPLYLRGELPTQRGIAIVGTRNPTEQAREFARELATAAVGEGWSVWSGGARGIDEEAHRGALEAGGPTVVVAGGGHDHPYPPENEDLFNRVLRSGGALLSLYPDDTPSFRWTFKCRNVVLVALTQLTVVGQAKEPPSGSMNAASLARKMGRPLLVVPGSPWEATTRGSALLLTRGADPVVSVKHAIDRAKHHLAVAPNLAPLAPPALPPMLRPRSEEGPRSNVPKRVGRRGDTSLKRSDDAEVLLAQLDAEGRSVDALCERTGMKAARVQRALLILTLRGDVLEEAGRYRRGRTG